MKVTLERFGEVIAQSGLLGRIGSAEVRINITNRGSPLAFQSED